MGWNFCETMTKTSVSFALLLLLGGCSGKPEPELEEWADDAYRPRNVIAYEVDGNRDGATTRAVVTFTLESGARLQLELNVASNPAPVLSASRTRFVSGPVVEPQDLDRLTFDNRFTRELRTADSSQL